jgi:hypothetical protein
MAEQQENKVFEELSNASDSNSNSTNLVDFSKVKEEVEEPHIVYEGQKYLLSTFNQFNIRDGQVYMSNPQIGLAIEVDIYNAEQVQALGIQECNAEMIKLQLARIKANSGRQVPEGYENKYCALFGGKVFHCFDTREELDDFRNGPRNVGLLYTFYYALK